MAAPSSALLRWANILAFGVTVIINGIAGSTTILGGRNTAAVSNSNPTLITPAGYVFSIWGVIYLLLAVFVAYQALPSKRGEGFQKRIGWLFVASSAANIVWIFVWQFEYLFLSVLFIFLLLLTLIAIYLRLGVGKSVVPVRERLAVHLPFSVYLGWITVASIADVAVTGVSAGWNGLGIGAETWAILVLVVALIITMLVLVTRRDLAYGLVVIWASVGTGVNHPANQTVVALTDAISLIVAVSLVVVVVAKLRHR